MSERVGRYVIRDAIAAGGMATVHVGRMVGAHGFSRTVAIKRLHKHLASDSEFVVMLLDEARVTSRVHHPFVIQTLDVVSEGDELLIVMEYVNGEALSRLWRRSRERAEPIDPSLAAAILDNVLQGLHAAHEASDEEGRPLGLVHRDVSPQNVLVGMDGVARVLDFGVAKAMGRAQTTREGQLKGKLAYMAPEQMEGGAVDRRCDVFAASIVLWELLTGDRLFGGEDDRTTIGRVLRAEVPPPSQRRPPIGAALDAVVLKGLARSPADRYATARDMALALEGAVSLATGSKVGQWVERLCGDEISDRQRRVAEIERTDRDSDAPVARVDESEQTKSVAAELDSAPPPRRTFPRSAALIALLAVALVTVGVAWAFSSARSRASKPTYEASLSSEVPRASASAMLAASPTASSTSPQSIVTPPAATTAPSSNRRAAPARTHHVDCSDPYTLDSDGRRRYRRECLQ